MALIGFFVTLVFLIAVGILVAVNRQAIEVNVWLTQPFEMPLWAVAMVPMIVGALIGLLVGRSSASAARRCMREECRKAQRLQRQLAAAQLARPEEHERPRVPAFPPPAIYDKLGTAQLLAGPAHKRGEGGPG
ncbi:MAG: LapA family protein [Rhodospirillales bacterium]|nr:LapA family protein [Rhodospirillales bacterium]